jgi:hypothetical protein
VSETLRKVRGTMGYVRETTGCVRKVLEGYAKFGKKKFPTPIAGKLLEIEPDLANLELMAALSSPKCEKNHGVKKTQICQL